VRDIAISRGPNVLHQQRALVRELRFLVKLRGEQKAEATAVFVIRIDFDEILKVRIVRDISDEYGLAAFAQRVFFVFAPLINESSACYLGRKAGTFYRQVGLPSLRGALAHR
jgi:hypothetical protein